MKNKKVYIGISIAALIIICALLSIFYIKSTNKDVRIAEFFGGNAKDNSKEAMMSKEEKIENEEEITNEKEEEKENVEENEVKEENNAAEEVAEEDNKEEIEKQEAAKKEEEKKAAEAKKKEEAKKESTKKEETKKVEAAPKKAFTVKDLDKKMYVTASSLNVRSGPETTYDKIGSLKNALEVAITGAVDGSKWYRISYNGKTGYVDGSYLSDKKPEVKGKQSSSNATVAVSEVSAVNAVIVINSRKNTLRYYVNGKLSQSFSCATGTSSTPTPQGKWKVVKKIVNRPYYKAGIPGGDPRNPLGKRWMGLNCNGTSGDTYGIHGTNNEGSIGSNASHGCIRMHNKDVEYFYDFVSVGTTVLIKNTSASDKEIAAGYGIYLE